MWLRSFSARALVLLTVSGILWASCGEDPKNPSDEEDEPVEILVEKDSLSQKLLQEIHAERQKTQKNDLDSIHSLIESWNKSLNEHNTELMRMVYAEKVQFYKNARSKAEVIDSKNKALQKTPEYRQHIKQLEVHYFENRPGVVHCEFKKFWSTGGVTDSTIAILELERIKGQFRIVKESDYVTELALIRLEKSKSLEDGHYYFLYDYWLDTRKHEALAHDFVPYYFSVHISKEKENVEVSFSWYSGSLRSITDFKVQNVQLSSSELRFEAAAMLDWDEEKLDDFQHFTFKILDGEMALIENDGWFYEMKGVRLWLVNLE